MTGIRYSNTGWSVDTPGIIPTNVPNLAIWLDADDASTFTYSSGVLVSQWNDKSGNGRHMFQAVVAAQPSRSGVINGRSSVAFAADGMAAASNLPWQFMSDGSGYTVFIVGRVENSGAAFPAFAGTTATFSAGSGFDILCQRAAAFVRHSITNLAADANVVDNIVPGVIPFATPFGFTITSTATEPVAADRSTLRIGGTNYQNNAKTATAAVGAPFSPLAIGARTNVDTGTQLTGQIAEFVVYQRALSTSERAAIESYLAAKWGVTL